MARRQRSTAVKPMVNPGGELMMLGQWRIALRQAEESARAGRYDEALALTLRPEVADHRQALQLRSRLAAELIERAGRRAGADDLAGGLADLTLAARCGAAPEALAGARQQLAERAAAELAPWLDAGSPGRAIERLDQLATDGITSPTLRQYRAVAEAWQQGLDDGRRGEFGRAREALDRAERLAGGLPLAPALNAARRDLQERQRAAGPRVERLYASLTEPPQWAAVLAAAEGVLEVVPEHPAARQARTRAWQQVGALGAGGGGLPARSGVAAAVLAPLRQEPAPPADPGIVFLDPSRPGTPPAPAGREPTAPASPRRFLLWADAVGGYLVCQEPEVVLGREGPGSPADVPLLADLSRRHATLIRQGDGYVIRAHHPTFVNGRAVQGLAPLRDQDVIRLGATVEILFRQPSPVSTTARLEIVSRHRLPLAVEGVVLMAETCILGPGSQAHVPAPGLTAPVVLFRQGENLWCRAPGPFEIDGHACQARAPLGPRSRVEGPGFSFGLEPLPGPATA